MNVLVPVADASEDIELACITDVLVRAGATVVTASVMPEGRTKVKLARGLTLVADCTIKECVGKQWDAIALPGGMPGAEHLRDSAELKELLLAQASAGKCVGAVCASPAVVFGTHGLLPARATCFPVDKFKAIVGSGWEDSRVVLDGNVITSQVLRTLSRSTHLVHRLAATHTPRVLAVRQGPGTSLQFALKIVEKLYSAEKAEELAKGLLCTTA